MARYHGVLIGAALAWSGCALPTFVAEQAKFVLPYGMIQFQSACTEHLQYFHPGMTNPLSGVNYLKINVFGASCPAYGNGLCWAVPPHELLDPRAELGAEIYWSQLGWSWPDESWVSAYTDIVTDQDGSTHYRVHWRWFYRDSLGNGESLVLDT